MTTDFSPTIGKRSKLAPAWIANLDPHKWIRGVGWTADSTLRLPSEAAAGSPVVQVILTESEGHWLAIAHCASGWFLFEPLSFISLWNDAGRRSAISTLECATVELYVDVKDPYVLRHPGLIPMEVSFDHSTDRFQRAVIYSLFPMDDRKN